MSGAVHRRIDVLFHFGYHPLGFPKGVQGMLRTSRCFAEILFQVGGPGALSSVVRHPYKFSLAEVSKARIALRFARITTKVFFNALAKIFARARNCTFVGKSSIGKSGPNWLATAPRTWSSATLQRTKFFTAAQNLGGHLAMQLVAIG